MIYSEANRYVHIHYIHLYPYPYKITCVSTRFQNLISSRLQISKFKPGIPLHALNSEVECARKFPENFTLFTHIQIYIHIHCMYSRPYKITCATGFHNLKSSKHQSLKC